MHVGFLIDGDPNTPHHAAALTISEEQILLEIPLLQDESDAYERWFEDVPPPDDLYLVTGSHNFHLAGASYRTRNINFNAVSTGRIVFKRLVRAGEVQPSYRTIHGLRTELAGLAGWMEPGVFVQTYETGADNRVTSAIFRAEHVAPIEVPSVPELSLMPWYDTRHDQANRLHSMRETIVVQTKFEDLTEWETHLARHQALQDLMSLVYWWPCNLETEQALRLEDEIMTLDGAKHGPEWHTAFVPDFGRRRAGVPIRTIPGMRFPLFSYTDIGEAGLEMWLNEYEGLRKSFGVLSASLFREGGTVEVEMLQVAVGLEELGYWLSGGVHENFIPTVLRVVNDTDCNLQKVTGRFATDADWASALNKAYKSVKHADNGALDGQEVYRRLAEGTLLARLWLARHLGVHRSELERNAHAYYPVR